MKTRAERPARFKNGGKVIALEARLVACRNVITLGVKPNFTDYSRRDVELIRKAGKIYFPTTFYAELFAAMGKETFPSHYNYACAQDKIKQNALFEMLNIPHPRTRIFYGRRQKEEIPGHFAFPFVAKIPRGSAQGRGVYLIRDEEQLRQYCNLTATAHIQEYLPSDRDIRVVVIGNTVVHTYWRIAPEREFRSNIAVGGKVGLEPVPDEAVQLALKTAKACGWDDAGIDILPHGGRFYVLEANMKYGKEGFRMAGIDYVRLLERMIENGII